MLEMSKGQQAATQIQIQRISHDSYCVTRAVWLQQAQNDRRHLTIKHLKDHLVSDC